MLWRVVKPSLSMKTRITFILVCLFAVSFSACQKSSSTPSGLAQYFKATLIKKESTDIFEATEVNARYSPVTNDKSDFSIVATTRDQAISVDVFPYTLGQTSTFDIKPHSSSALCAFPYRNLSSSGLRIFTSCLPSGSNPVLKVPDSP